MRYKQTVGSWFKVYVSSDEVEVFADKWPCSGFHRGDRAVFEFDRNGDLVDLAIIHAVYGKRLNTDYIDGQALVALSQDALNYARSGK